MLTRNPPAPYRETDAPGTCEPQAVRYRCPVCGFGSETAAQQVGHQEAEAQGRTAYHGRPDGVV